ncbi:hypothetical protein ISF_08671 [Cordyceps fumosorosea ARSEF 2679]|uniref:ubiquitinyl hydrolase 1 n=1 Tax=Cordyceps fumosorosea (strain ARSEF 2679) TaxID=1081104 RepID=A0A167LZQ2_CORFA|nr:hypothetical protein ISF_08671 [Cordyceps fumosorosea ARSEF 2679]OAA53732.1 hypothetical protein ISF_08671 [Cordyceps fumosorosea ARSEF 2679]
MEMERPRVDAPALRALIKDIFLLPDLPEENLEIPFLEDLPKLLIYALEKCEALLPDECHRKLRQCRNTVGNFLGARANTLQINQQGLYELLTGNSAAPIPLYLPHHNAGVVIRWGVCQRRVEIFQLSPRVDAVTSTVGRLRRQFPEMSVTIEEKVAADEDFAQAIAETLSEMDKEEVPGLKTGRVFRRKRYEDKCDVTLCDHVVDILFPYLLTEKSTSKDVPIGASIMKHTRDFVRFVDAKKSIARRSPAWLLFKVVLQQELRHESSPNDYSMYKQFMLVFLSLLLEAACDHNFDALTLHCMARKIGYRALKLQDKASGEWMATVECAVKRASNELKTNWAEIVKADQAKRAKSLAPFIFDATDCRIKHPGLDKFLAKIRDQPPSEVVLVAEPKSDTIEWPPGKLPNMAFLTKESPESIIFNLIKVEQWVEDYLQSFVESHKTDKSTCSDISKFATAYFKQATSTYKDFPYHISIMYLTLLELWLACDECAVARHHLLKEYAPLGVEEVNLESLMLRTGQEMLRLSKIEDYLRDRSSDALDMLAQYGKADCFGARFARSSEQHKRLMAAIEDDMDKQKQEKSKELDSMKMKQKWHLECHEKSECDVLKCRVGIDKIPCKRCLNFAMACSLSVQPLRSMLPEDSDLAQTIVFELAVPPDISAWRDFCFFILLEVAGYESQTKDSDSRDPDSEDPDSDSEGSDSGGSDSDSGEEAKQDHDQNSQTRKEKRVPFISYIQNYPIFCGYFKSESKRRIVLASPSERTKDKAPVPVRQDTQLSRVCTPHPMNWQLFDSKQGNFIKMIGQTDVIRELCSFDICHENELLRRALTNDDPAIPKNQNELISLRLEAENVAMLKHNEELGSLYFGDHVMWIKLLRELRGTSIDWAAPETFLFMSQMVFEVGPREGEGPARQRHFQLSNETFAAEFVKETRRLLSIYADGRSGRKPLAVLCIIAIKMTNEAPEPCRNAALDVLAAIRKRCFGWLSDNRQSRLNDTPEMLETHLEIALICAYTFAVDYYFLKHHILSDNQIKNVERYIVAMTTIHENQRKVTSYFQKTLYSASLRLAVSATGILMGQIQRGILGGIRNGLIFSCEQNMQLSPVESYISPVSGPWIKTCTRSFDRSAPKAIHLNLMTGEIRIDGKNPRHLPACYTSHEDFVALFGGLSPTVIPVDDAIYRYQFRNQFEGFRIRVGMKKIKLKGHPPKFIRELHVRATKGGHVSVLLPRRILSLSSFPFPDEYLSAHLHWHQITKEDFRIDFYPRQSAWDPSSIAWELQSQHDGWVLKERGRDRVVMPTSLAYYNGLSRVFEHFVTEKDFHVIFNKDAGVLEARLGILGLNFFINDGERTIRSFEFEDMAIDHDYSLKTLIGLQPKLILRCEKDRKSRTLLVADGEERAWQTAGHTEVTVAINQDTTVQTYTINEALGQLRGNQTWRSKAYLAYLYALTSHCLPDPFTSNTGQETALEILTSGAILSFDSLDEKDCALLEKISHLAPEQHFRNRRGARPVTLKWNDKLQPGLHHDGYYTAVQNILDHAQTLDSFANCPKTYRRKVTEAEEKLMKADTARLSCFRVPGYSNHDGSRDADYYFRIPDLKPNKGKGKGKGKENRGEEVETWDYAKSEAFRRAYSAAFGAKHRRRFNVALPSTSGVLSRITSKGTAKAGTEHYELENLRYSAKWVDPEETGALVQDFCSILRVLTGSSLGERNKYRLRLWLSTVAFGINDEVARVLVPILSALINQPRSDWKMPTRSSSNTTVGHECDADQLVAILNNAKRPFTSQQGLFVNETGVSEEVFLQDQDNAIANLVGLMVGAKGVVDMTAFAYFLHVDQAIVALDCRFRDWDVNKSWNEYCEHLCSLVLDLTVSEAKPPAVLLALVGKDKARVTKTDSTLESVIRHSDTFPHISLRWFLKQLSFRRGSTSKLESGWSTLIRQIAALCRDRQHMDRLIKASSDETELLNELQTIDRYSYDDSLFPDAVLLEIEQDICLRANQLETATRMRDPPSKENSVMQLNMGEGKSSIIIPILSASLAQGKSLVRVFVGRHQSAQMMDTMTAAIGGLMNRTVFRMPYNRDSKLADKEIKKVKDSLVQCVNTGGVLLLQPEHHQSLLLSTCLNEDTTRTKSYLNLVKYLRLTCRDIIDECDELLSPKHELLYTIGTPAPVDFAPDRWLLIQGLLEILPREEVIAECNVLCQQDPKRPGGYPNLCFLSPASPSEVLTEAARVFIIDGVTGFRTSRYSGPTKKAIKMFTTETHPTAKCKKTLKKLGQAARSGLALVRGCIAHDILRAALQKRWRVDYGCDFARTPSTRLAVPFAAKDVPKLRSEFSNTDLVIILTHLSFYYGGLREQDVRELIEHMCAADDGHDVYKLWIRDSRMLSGLPELNVINLQDEKQFQQRVFPNLRYSVKAINYFLSRLVFPTELIAFTQHMAASGWDLAEKMPHPKTGFSGTADQCALLPLDMKQQNLASQIHTDAFVLNNVLHSDNIVFSMHAGLEKRAMDGEDVVEHVIQDGRIRVIIDVGAQILRLTNREVAERWLAQTEDGGIKAVVFFNESEVLSVWDGSGVAPLKTSTYSNKLDSCAVFLDEAHTRGTDLRLPLEYKAAVTVGPGLTKDRLAQACMRMRSLGKGQTLVFYLSFEAENNIRVLLQLSDKQPIAVEHIVQWSIVQTQTSIARQMPLWAKQGRRYEKKNKAWNYVLNMKNPSADSYEGIEQSFIQKDVNNVEKSYAPRPRPADASSHIQGPTPGKTEDDDDSNTSSETEVSDDSTLDSLDSQFIKALTERCRVFGCAGTVADDLDETCEREVAPEVEDEKQVCKPPKPIPNEYTRNRALGEFIHSGKVFVNEDGGFQGLEWAFESLHRTTLASMVKELNFPRNLVVSRDFAKPIDTEDHMDDYQQHVAFILRVKTHLQRHELPQVVVVISQQDAEQYWQEISASKSIVELEIYNAKVVLPQAVVRPALTNDKAGMHPTAIRIALDLFAGQLYFMSCDEYFEVSSFLGLAYFEAPKGFEVDPDGFIPPPERHKIPAWHCGPDRLWDTFDSSPVSFFKRFLGVIRGHGAGIEHTHMGKMLDGQQLGPTDFPGRYRLPCAADVVEGAKGRGRGGIGATRLETRAQRDQRKRGHGDEGAAGAKEGPAAKRPRSEEGSELSGEAADDAEIKQEKEALMKEGNGQVKKRKRKE